MSTMSLFHMRRHTTALLQAHAARVCNAEERSSSPLDVGRVQGAGQNRRSHEHQRQRDASPLHRDESPSRTTSDGDIHADDDFAAATSQALVARPASEKKRGVPGAARMFLLTTAYLRQRTQDAGNRADVSVNYAPHIGVDELLVC